MSDETMEVLGNIVSLLEALTKKVDGLAAAKPASSGGKSGWRGKGKVLSDQVRRDNLVVQSVDDEEIPKKAGGTFTKYNIVFANGWKRSTTNEDQAVYFADRIGQEAPFTEGKNQRGYFEIAEVG